MVKLAFIMVMVIFVTVYFIPALIAIGRKHVHVLQITILNTFLGWSFLGWVASLIWSTTDYTDRSTKTKGSWIIIGCVFLLSISPILVYSVIPKKYKTTNFIQETEYKKTVYTINSGKIIKEETEKKHIEKD